MDTGDTVQESVKSKKWTAGKVILILLRFFIVILFGIAIGLAAYFGVPALYRNVIEPIQAHETRLTGVEQEIDVLREDLVDIINNQAEQINELEVEISSAREAFSALETHIYAIDELVVDLKQNQQILLAPEDESTEMMADLGLLGIRIDELEIILAAMVAEQSDTEDVAVLSESTCASIPGLSHQIEQLRALAYLDRAHFEAVDDNIGLARTDMLAAYDILAGINEQASAEVCDLLEPIIERLDLALQNLEDRPTFAIKDIELVWSELAALTLPLD